jgi:hypothetical protein
MTMNNTKRKNKLASFILKYSFGANSLIHKALNLRIQKRGDLRGWRKLRMKISIICDLYLM